MSVKTSQSLLQEAKHDPQSEAWFQLNSIYDPLISGWIVRAGVEESEVGDITQEVLQTLAQDLSKFEHNGRVGAFRNWLKTITIHRCRRYWDKKKKRSNDQSLNSNAGIHVLNELEDPCSDFSVLWDKEHDDFVFEKILELIRNEFEPQVFEIFVRNTIEGDSPKLLASQFGITIGNIYKIKSVSYTHLTLPTIYSV